MALALVMPLALDCLYVGIFQWLDKTKILSVDVPGFVTFTVCVLNTAAGFVFVVLTARRALYSVLIAIVYFPVVGVFSALLTYGIFNTN